MRGHSYPISPCRLGRTITPHGCRRPVGSNSNCVSVCITIMTEAPSVPMTPEASTKEGKLRWLHDKDATDIIRSIIFKQTLPADQYMIVRISDTEAYPRHDFALSKGLDFDYAIADYEIGKIGYWKASQSQIEGCKFKSCS